MKLTEVSTNSQDIFPFFAPLGNGVKGGKQGYHTDPLYSLLIGVWRLIGLLLLGDPALPSHMDMFNMHACVCQMC